MADLAYPTLLVPSAPPVLGRGRAVFSGTALAPAVLKSLGDRRIANPTTGTITDRVVVKSGAAEVPYVDGRVWLLRLSDGFKAWEGWSDAAGYYTATGLEIGVEYVMLAIDPTRTHKTTGAGPVMAT